VSVPGVIVAECLGAMIGLALHRALPPRTVSGAQPNVIERSGD